MPPGSHQPCLPSNDLQTCNRHTPPACPHPTLCRSDPALFPFILAYLRDGRVPPLPQGLLELRQLRVEAEFFAMAELAEAVAAAQAALEAAADQAAAAAAAEQKHAADQQQLGAVRAEVLAAADAAVKEATAAAVDATAHPGFQELQEAQAHLDEQRGLWEQAEDMEPGVEIGLEALRMAHDNFFNAEAAVDELHNDPGWQEAVNAEAAAQKRLRDALLARLCALGADLPTAEAMLRVTHPKLAQRKFD